MSVAWLLVVAFAATLLARLFSHVGYWVDMVAIFAPHLAALAAALGVVCLVLRQRAPGVALLLVAAIHGAWMTVGRAPRATPGIDTIHLMTFNSLSDTADPATTVDLLALGLADVVVMLESDRDVVAGNAEVAARYPHRLLHSRILKLSRWPIELTPNSVEARPELEYHHNYRMSLVVLHPETPFVLTVLTPRSPRNAERWHVGNEYLEHELELFEKHFLPLGLPLVVATDLNATPTSWRSTYVRRRLGLLRAKPPFVPAGTWPAFSPSPLRVAIDDVLVGPGIGVASWRTLEFRAGSDHVPVIVELAIPPTPGFQGLGERAGEVPPGIILGVGPEDFVGGRRSLRRLRGEADPRRGPARRRSRGPRRPRRGGGRSPRRAPRR